VISATVGSAVSGSRRRAAGTLTKALKPSRFVDTLLLYPIHDFSHEA
jgi:hypothetical protein